MIALSFLLLLVSLCQVQGKNVPSPSEIQSSINRTINEVERLIREDPKLPQLSRQDIVNILYNITSKELNLYDNKDSLESARKMYQRALMVVLPYNANDTSGSLNELYTKPPMVHLITDPSNAKHSIPPKLMTQKKEETPKDVKTTKELKITTQIPLDNFVSQSSEKIVKETQPTTAKSRYKNHRETYSEVRTKASLKDSLKLDSPLRFSFNLENLQRNSYTTEKPTTRRPVYRRPESQGEFGSKLEIVYSTSVSTEPTTEESSKEITIDLEKSKSSTRYNQNFLSADQWRYNAPPPTTQKNNDSAVSPSEEGIVPTAKVDKSTTSAKANEDDERETSAPIYVTPMTSTGSQVPLDTSAPQETFGTPKPIPKEEVMDLLASIGLRPDDKSNVEDVYEKSKDILETKFQIPDTNSVIYTTTSGLTAIGPESPSIASQNTFEHQTSDLKSGINNLTPDVQMLFQRFGLQTSNIGTSTSTTQKSTVSLNSYTNFKPLPTSDVKDQEMKEFLAQFGLGTNDRRQKSMRTTTESSMIEAVPENMRKVLEDIGLVTNTRRRRPKTQTEATTTETTKYHIFKPHESILKDEKQKTRINELLDKVRLVQQGKADVQEVQKAANDLLQGSRSLKNGPDPLTLEEILKNYNEAKNDVKRQQGEENSTTTTEENQSFSSVAMNDTFTTTSETPNAEDSAKASSDQFDSSTPETESTTTQATNLLALEESFGGSTRAPDPVLPARRKSGLYFLVDWNTFLEVGEEDAQKISLRFQPKVGDRTRFLPVKIP